MTEKVNHHDILTIKESLLHINKKLDDPISYLRLRHHMYSLPELKSALNISEDTLKKYIEEGVGSSSDRVFLRAVDVGVGSKKRYMVKMIWVDEFFNALESRCVANQNSRSDIKININELIESVRE